MHDLSHRLTDKEFDRLEELLHRSDSEDAMNLEEVDGFFAALVCGPDFVLPSECLPEIWGLDSSEADAPFDSVQELQECLDLLVRHWNNIAETLSSGEIFLPVLLEDDDGIVHANDWAQGFMWGVEMRREAWGELFDDEEHQGLLLAILILVDEHNPDPEMRPYKEPVSAELREELVVGAAAAVRFIYDYFAAHRRMDAATAYNKFGPQRKQPKIGRNDPCPCASGKKYKRCCGQAPTKAALN
jgi:uncharacterized protein